MITDAYEYGRRLALAERGYGNAEDFQKEAAGLLGTVGQAARMGATRGALAGAAVGGVGNAAFGDSNQSVLERFGRGAGAGVLIGGGLGGAGAAGAQSLYRKSMTGQMSNAMAALPKTQLMQNGKRTFMGIAPAARQAALKPFENRPFAWSGGMQSAQSGLGRAHAGLAKSLFG